MSVLPCFSDFQIILSRKFSQSLPLEDVVFMGFGKLRVAVLSHLGHLDLGSVVSFNVW